MGIELEKMRALMVELRPFGAGDSEPRGELDDVIAAADEGRVFPERLECPGCNPWQLFESVKGYGMANRRLTTQARRVWRERRNERNEKMRRG